MPVRGLDAAADLKRAELVALALHVGRFGYFVDDHLSGTTTWSPEVFGIWGVAPSPELPHDAWFFSTLHAEDAARVAQVVADKSWSDKSVDFRIRLPTGEERHVRAQCKRARDAGKVPIKTFGVIMDITELRRAEIAMERSEARLQSMLEMSGAGIILTDTRAKILFVNAAFAQLLGYTRDELIGTSIRTLSPPEEIEALYRMVTDMRAGQLTGASLEKRYIRKDGGFVWVKLTLNIVPDADGGHCFLGVVQDLTERHLAETRLKESQELIEQAQGAARIGHWVWWPDARIVEWSPEMCRIMGIPEEQRHDPPAAFVTYIHPDDRPAFMTALRSLLEEQKHVALEYRVVRSDGEIRYVLGRSVAVDDGVHGRRLVGLVQDITERKASEDALREASIRAEAANSAKTQFLASMSHELRTPLNAVLGFAQLLATEAKGALNPDQRSYVDSILRGGKLLQRLIDDVLDLSRIDTGRLMLNIEAVAVDEVLNQVFDAFRPMAAERQIRLALAASTEAAVLVSCDRLRLTQVIANLASNAIKYNRPGGSVSFGAQRLGDTSVRIFVTDTGRGISEARRSEVFKTFSRLGAEASGEDGTGIGLALSRRLVEEMRGAIGFDSEPGVGSTFWVVMPKAGADTLHQGQDVAAPWSTAAE
jgi:PAS domain S-box-containing protein